MRTSRVFVAVAVLLAVAGYILYSGGGEPLRGSRSVLAQENQSDQVDQATLSTAQEPTPHEIDFPYYSLRDGFHSTLVLVNASPEALRLVVAIHGLSGRTRETAPMLMPDSGKMTLDLATLLSELSSDVTGEFAEGSVSVHFKTAIMMPLVGQLTVSNPERRISFQSEMGMMNQFSESASTPNQLHSLWWGIGVDRDAVFAISNASDKQVVADVFLDFAGERHRIAPLEFHRREAKLLSVTGLLSDLNASPAQAPEGGITIIPRGPNPGLIAEGHITDPTTGFSTTLRFLDPAAQKTSALHASGVPIGTPTKDSPYGGAGTFTPHVVVRNLLSLPQTATITVEYAGSEGPEETKLAPLNLQAYQTSDIALDTAFELLPLPLPYCSIRIQYSGPPGSLTAGLASVEAEQDLVVDSRLVNEGDMSAGSGANPWHLDKETESVLFLTNMGNKIAHIGFDMTALGAHYYLTKLQLGPHETRAIDLRQLRDAQQPDFLGGKVPLNATDGAVLWIRAGDVPVMGRLVVLERAKGWATNFDCSNCACAASYTGLSVTPTSAYIAPLTTVDMTATATMTTPCTQTKTYCDVTGQCYWSSNNTGVVTVNSSGVCTGVAAGKASVTGKYTAQSWNWNSFQQQCLATNVSHQASCGMTCESVSVALSPSSVVPQGQTTVTATLTPTASNHSVTLSVAEVAYSGGHQHTSRPLGAFGASSGTTNTSGQFSTTYTASSFGGSETISASIDVANGSSTLTVNVGGLSQLGSGTNYTLVGATTTHPSNHYGTSTANSDLNAIANAYAAAYPGSVFNYNDQSLVQGGLFDTSGNWATPHIEHRYGINCDISKSNVSSDRYAYVTGTIFPANGVTSYLDEGNHWHVRFGTIGGTGGE